LHEDSYFYTGVVQAPNGYRQALECRCPPRFPVTMEVLKRGQERFNIYCTPCHSRVGNGLGEIVQRGFKPAGNLHDQVRLSQPISHYFYVMTHGYGAMPDYSAQLTPSDRWAVAAYIRALQLSQAATAGCSCRHRQEPERRCAPTKGIRNTRSPGPCRRRRSRLTAHRQPGNAGHGSGLSRRSCDFDSQDGSACCGEANRDYGIRDCGREVKGRVRMAHETNPAFHADASRRPWRAGLCRRLEDRALVIGAIFAVIAVILGFLGQAQDGLGWDHFLRAWTLGTMWTWGLCVGGLALLMVQYCSGGKWGLLLRRPLRGTQPHPAGGLRLLAA
jgi:hypothetical protein